MTTELTKAAQQALDRLDALAEPTNGLLAVPENSATVSAIQADLSLIRAALTQRPAAQTEREAFERAALEKWGPLDFKRSEAVPEMYYNQRLDDAWIGFGFAVAWLRASVTAPREKGDK